MGYAEIVLMVVILVPILVVDRYLFRKYWAPWLLRGMEEKEKKRKAKKLRQK